MSMSVPNRTAPVAGAKYRPLSWTDTSDKNKVYWGIAEKLANKRSYLPVAWHGKVQLFNSKKEAQQLCTSLMTTPAENDGMNVAILAKTGHGRFELADHYNLRLDGFFDLGSSCGAGQLERPEGPQEDWMDLVWDEESGKKQSLPSMHPLLSALAKADVKNMVDDEVAGALIRSGFLGYCARFCVPVYSEVTESSCTYSWGHTQSVWVYGESMEDLWVQAVDWAIKRKALDRAKNN